MNLLSLIEKDAADGKIPRHTFGVEIETKGVSVSDAAYFLESHGFGEIGWCAKFDGSLYGSAAEIVSPILTGADGIGQIYQVCEMLKKEGATIDRQCGMHLHIGFSGPAAKSAVLFAEFCLKWQSAIFSLVAPSRRTSTYCKSVYQDIIRIDAMRKKSLLAFADFWDGQTYMDRYTFLNICSIKRHGTVEMRCHHGTVDGDEIAAWILLFLAIRELAEKSAFVRFPHDKGYAQNLQPADSANCKFFLRDSCLKISGKAFAQMRKFYMQQNAKFAV